MILDDDNESIICWACDRPAVVERDGDLVKLYGKYACERCDEDERASLERIRERDRCETALETAVDLEIDRRLGH